MFKHYVKEFNTEWISYNIINFLIESAHCLGDCLKYKIYHLASVTQRVIINTNYVLVCQVIIAFNCISDKQ